MGSASPAASVDTDRQTAVWAVQALQPVWTQTVRLLCGQCKPCSQCGHRPSDCCVGSASPAASVASNVHHPPTLRCQFTRRLTAGPAPGVSDWRNALLIATRGLDTQSAGSFPPPPPPHAHQPNPTTSKGFAAARIWNDPRRSEERKAQPHRS